MKAERRSALKKLALSVLGFAGIRAVSKAESVPPAPEKAVANITYDQEVPLFSGMTKLGNMIFIAGKGAHYAGDVKQHTDTVLKELEKELVAAGSSMEKVLKVTVYLNDIADWEAMNTVFKGRFGAKPPVRTTVAVARGGVPGNSLVEMDCIAYV